MASSGHVPWEARVFFAWAAEQRRLSSGMLSEAPQAVRVQTDGPVGIGTVSYVSRADSIVFDRRLVFAVSECESRSPKSPGTFLKPQARDRRGFLRDGGGGSFGGCGSDFEAQQGLGV